MYNFMYEYCQFYKCYFTYLIFVNLSLFIAIVTQIIKVSYSYKNAKIKLSVKFITSYLSNIEYFLFSQSSIFLGLSNDLDHCGVLKHVCFC